MAERKSVNKYYPPDWDPSQGSINRFRKAQASKGLKKEKGDGSVTIRFEMPFNIWCGGCGAHIAMGVRFNARKKKVGDYFSTPIYSFRMKCAQCPNWFEIRTNPQETDYTVVEGARRKIENWTPEPGTTILKPEEDLKTQKKRATNAFFRLERIVEDENRSLEAKPYLEKLLLSQEMRWKDDFLSSQIVREKFRQEQKDERLQREKDLQLIKKRSLTGLNLLPELPSDISLATAMKFGNNPLRKFNLANLVTSKRKKGAQ